MAQIVPAFAVPFVESQHPNCGALNAELRQVLLSFEAAGDNWRNQASSMRVNPQMFESRFTLFAERQPAIQKLREFCWAELAKAIASLNGYGPEEASRLQIGSHTWFHVTRKGGWFGLHNHPMASWSGVYCVDPGQPDATNPESGALHFSNPLQLANMYVDPANQRMRAPFGMGGKSYNLRAGQLVLFPSWVNHWVEPFTGDGTRITVAFNCWFETAPAA